MKTQTLKLVRNTVILFSRKIFVANKVLFILGLLFLAAPVFNQVTDSTSMNTKKKYNHYIGANAGFITGVGASYRFMSGKSGCQVTAMPLYDEENMYLSLGANYIREINDFDSSKFVFYAGNHITNFFGQDNTFAYNVGLGLGFDVATGNILFNFMIGYAGLDIFDNFKTRPVVEMGLFLRLN